MKKKINHILPALVLTASLGLTTVSCNGFLDEMPDNRTELNTDQKIAKLLVSAYADVSPNELFELYSDNSDDSGPTYGYYKLSEQECYHWQDTKEEYQDTPNSLWGGYYSAIAAANMALNAIEEKGNPASLDPQRGEALVCRAYCHFMLANIFCNAYDTHASQSLGVPYMEEVETTVSPRYERGTLEEVYRKVERDLLEGIDLISDDSYSVPKYHFTRKAAYAFAARFYLYYMKPDFSNCDRVIDFATRVLGTNPADLLRNWEALGNLSVNGNVQADAYIASSNEANLLISSTVSNWGAIGSDYLIGPRYFHNQTLATSETCLSSGLWGSSDYFYLKPFSTNGFVASILRKSGLYEGTYLYYMPVLFSTDETLLCRAEAYALKKMYAQSAADITSWQRAYTRNKSVLTPEQINTYYDKMSFYTPFTQQTPKKKLAPDFTIEEGMQENFIHCILHIRRITTLHEGMRWPDIKRYGILIYRRDMANQRVTDENASERLALCNPNSEECDRGGNTTQPEKKLTKKKVEVMKKQLIYFLLALTAVCLGACNNDDEIDTAHSIFSTEPVERNAFDDWLLDNYTYPYNIDFMYRMKDIESDHKYNLVPADYDKAVALSKIIKHVWMDAYVELAGIDFLRVYVPKTFHLIGSPAYESSGNMVLGTAEGGKKITLYNVNDLNVKKINIEKLNNYYFETMHHEFAHILHQKRNFDPSFNRISEGKYVGADWYYYMTAEGAMPRTNDIAWPDGFVTAYAMNQANEDFVENIAMYVTHTQTYWDNMLRAAGETGAATINKKFAIVYNYMRDTWGIDLNELRKIVLRRQQEITEIDLSTIQ